MCHDHVFKIYTIVANIDDGIDLVFGFKIMVETEGMLNTRTGEFDFLGRSISIFPKRDLDVKPGGKAYLKVKMPFVEKLSGRALCKMFTGVYSPCSSFEHGTCWFVGCCSINALGNVVRAYPEIVQGLTFYRSKI